MEFGRSGRSNICFTYFRCDMEHLVNGRELPDLGQIWHSIIWSHAEEIGDGCYLSFNLPPAATLI